VAGEVNVVASAPVCSAPCITTAAPLSLRISITAGTVPHKFRAPAAARASVDSPIGVAG